MPRASRRGLGQHSFCPLETLRWSSLVWRRCAREREDVSETAALACASIVSSPKLSAGLSPRRKQCGSPELYTTRDAAMETRGHGAWDDAGK